MLQTQQQQRSVSTRDADGVTVKRVARCGGRRKRSVEKQNCRWPERRKNKGRVGNHRHPREDCDGNEPIDEHEQRPDAALGKAVKKMNKPQPPGDAANDLGVKQCQPRWIFGPPGVQPFFRVEIQFVVHEQTAEKLKPLPFVLTEIFVKPAAASLAGSAEGSTGTRVSRMYSSLIIMPSVLTMPAKIQPVIITLRTFSQCLF